MASSGRGDFPILSLTPKRSSSLWRQQFYGNEDSQLQTWLQDWIFGSSGGPVIKNLAMSATAEATGTLALKRAKFLALIATAEASGTLVLTRARLLAMVATADATGSLSALRARLLGLSGTAEATGSLALVRAKFLAMAGTGEATGLLALRRVRYLSVSGSAEASGSVALTVTHRRPRNRIITRGVKDLRLRGVIEAIAHLAIEKRLSEFLLATEGAVLDLVERSFAYADIAYQSPSQAVFNKAEP